MGEYKMDNKQAKELINVLTDKLDTIWRLL
jgi:hypothetical protein